MLVLTAEIIGAGRAEPKNHQHENGSASIYSLGLSIYASGLTIYSLGSSVYSSSFTTISSGVSQASKKGTSNSIYEQLNPDGSVASRTFYDNNENAFARQDFDHPHFDKATQQYLQPHEHNTTFNQNGQPTGATVNPVPTGYNNSPSNHSAIEVSEISITPAQMVVSGENFVTSGGTGRGGGTGRKF